MKRIIVLYKNFIYYKQICPVRFWIAVTVFTIFTICSLFMITDNRINETKIVGSIMLAIYAIAFFLLSQEPKRQKSLK